MSTDKMLKKQLVVPVWRLWLMNQVYRFTPGNKQGFGPGFAALIRYEALRFKYWFYEQDRLRWKALRLRALLSRNTWSWALNILRKLKALE